MQEICQHIQRKKTRITARSALIVDAICWHRSVRLHRSGCTIQGICGYQYKAYTDIMISIKAIEDTVSDDGPVGNLKGECGGRRLSIRAQLAGAARLAGIQEEVDTARLQALSHASDAIEYLAWCMELGRTQSKYIRVGKQAARDLLSLALPAAAERADGGAVAALEAIRGTAEALRDALRLRLEAGAAGLDVSAIRLPGDLDRSETDESEK